MLPSVRVADPSSLTQPLVSTPSSTRSLSVPPSLKLPVNDPSRSSVPESSQSMPAEPQPAPNPIQNPLRSCGCPAQADEEASSAMETARAHLRGTLTADLPFI